MFGVADLHGSLLHSVLEHGSFLNMYILQGNVMTCLKCVGIFNDGFIFIANLLVSLSVNFENLSTFEVANISIVAPDTHIVDIEWYE